MPLAPPPDAVANWSSMVEENWGGHVPNPNLFDYLRKSIQREVEQGALSSSAK